MVKFIFHELHCWGDHRFAVKDSVVNPFVNSRPPPHQWIGDRYLGFYDPTHLSCQSEIFFSRQVIIIQDVSLACLAFVGGLNMPFRRIIGITDSTAPGR